MGYNAVIKTVVYRGKAKKVCKFAELNKFLRIYYARVIEAKVGGEIKRVA